MDKKNAILGSVFLLASVIAMMLVNKQNAESLREAEMEAASNPPPTETSGSDGGGLDDFSSEDSIDSFVRETTIEPASDQGEEPEPEMDVERVTLENDYIRAHFTSFGGSLETIELKGYPATQDSGDPVVLHERAHEKPLSLMRAQGSGYGAITRDYRLISSDENEVIFEATLAVGIKIRRIYSLVPGDEGAAPYTIHHRTELFNPTDKAFNFDRVFINTGTAAPTNTDPYGMDLSAAYFEEGDYEYIAASKFSGGGFLFFRSAPKDKIERTGQMQWAAVKNQFFASILTPVAGADAFTAEKVEYPVTIGDDSKKIPFGVTGYMRFALPSLAPGENVSLEMDFYSGPKDFKRLSSMGQDQEDVMHLGWFLMFFIGFIGFVGKMLLWLLTHLHGWIGNWGFAIIVMTLIVRIILYPLTAKAARAGKRMQELSKPMQEIKEKYKDNPQKQQQATLDLFRKHGVNPLSGCWPLLIQFPIFIAMFNLLRNTADLRFAEFLWISDLSMPDQTIPLGTNVAFVGSHINILPFFWVASMWFQMKLMPQPSVDNAQAKIVKYMPFIFFPFTYMFSSGLVLYWTTTNLFSIFQGWMTRRVKDAEDIKIEQEIAESEGGKKLNVNRPLISKKKKKKRDGR